MLALEAIGRRDTQLLTAAIEEALAAGLEAVEVDTAKSLLEQELQRAALWKELLKAQEQRQGSGSTFRVKRSGDD